MGYLKEDLSFMIKRQLPLCTLAVVLLIFESPAVWAAKCEADMYNDASFKESLTDFSPYDKIFIIVECTDLSAGNRTMHVNWINQKRGLIRSDTHEFEMKEAGKRSVYFWFKLSKKGPLESAFTNQDFNEKFFGNWTVEVYMDDELAFSRDFTIEPGIQ